ncbi:MAG: hypothetical protein IIC60_11640 [Proteobacteria bacterium]|nr:hypothetical protein [Pseudomonadota bacterium]
MLRLLPRFTRLFTVAVFAMVSACAANPDRGETRRLPTDAEVEQYNAAVEPAERIVCRQETPVGSNIPKRVCRYVRDIEETSAFHREQLRRALN